MTTIYAQDADGREHYHTVYPDNVAKTIKQLTNRGMIKVRVI